MTPNLEQYFQYFYNVFILSDIIHIYIIYSLFYCFVFNRINDKLTAIVVDREEQLNRTLRSAPQPVRMWRSLCVNKRQNATKRCEVPSLGLSLFHSGATIGLTVITDQS